MNHTNTAGAAGAGKKSKAGKGGTSAPTTTIGIPPLKQQFTADDTTFRSAMSSAQAGIVRLPATTTPQQVAGKLLPLLVAANAYQSQMVNLPWSSSVKPLAQSLTQNVGQLDRGPRAGAAPGVFFLRPSAPYRTVRGHLVGPGGLQCRSGPALTVPSLLSDRVRPALTSDRSGHHPWAPGLLAPATAAC